MCTRSAKRKLSNENSPDCAPSRFRRIRKVLPAAYFTTEQPARLLKLKDFIDDTSYTGDA